jgi:hypothetical protein
VQSGLIDLDELVLLCRNEEARMYIREAVGCYKAGAYRASIVATWIAVAYDIIAKLRELALAGDKQAELEVDAFNRIRESENLQGSLKFEREILTLAKDRFELISAVEFNELERLQQDRNRCAHPSMNTSDEAYLPPPELARLHLRNAVVSLLQRPPVQGKAALERIMKEIASPYFPESAEAVETHFRHGPLARPRESLVRSVITILIKWFLSEEADESGFREFHQRAAAILALLRMHPAVVRDVLSSRLSDMVRGLEHQDLGRVLNFVHLVNELWDHLMPDVKALMENYTLHMPTHDLANLEYAHSIPELADHARRRTARLTVAEAYDELLFYTYPELVDRRVALYTQVHDAAVGSRLGRLLLIEAKWLTEHHFDTLLSAASQNKHIRDSPEIFLIFRRIEEGGVVPAEVIRKKLDASGLK